jgi:hypothetical protein
MKGKAKPSLRAWIANEVDKIDRRSSKRSWMYPREFARKTALEDVLKELTKRGG